MLPKPEVKNLIQQVRVEIGQDLSLTPLQDPSVNPMIAAAIVHILV